MSTAYSNLKVTNRSKSEIELEAQIPSETIAANTEILVREAQRDMELPGFRKGKAPLERVRENLNLARVLEDAAHLALEKCVPEIIRELKIAPMGSPQVTILNLSLNKPVSFRFRAPLLPEFKLPDYRRIGDEAKRKTESTEVSDREVEEALNQLRDLRAPRNEKGEPTGVFELTDETARTLGEFKDLAELKTRVKENISEEKREEARRQNREEIAGKLLDGTKIEVSPVLVEEEAARMRSRREEEAKRRGLTMDEFLKQINKTEEDLAKEERAYIERQFKTKLILSRIAEEEGLAPQPEVLAAHTAFLSRRYPEADPENLRAYATELIRNEMVLEFLETGKKPGEKGEDKPD